MGRIEGTESIPRECPGVTSRRVQGGLGRNRRKHNDIEPNRDQDGSTASRCIRWLLAGRAGSHTVRIGEVCALLIMKLFDARKGSTMSVDIGVPYDATKQGPSTQRGLWEWDEVCRCAVQPSSRLGMGVRRMLREGGQTHWTSLLLLSVTPRSRSLGMNVDPWHLAAASPQREMERLIVLRSATHHNDFPSRILLLFCPKWKHVMRLKHNFAIKTHHCCPVTGTAASVGTW